MRAVQISGAILSGVLLCSLAGCQLNRGLSLQQVQSRFEELGSVSAHAQHCGAPVDPAEVRVLLDAYAERNGASPAERESLFSYYEAARDLELRQIGNTPCDEDDRMRSAALLQERLNDFRN